MASRRNGLSCSLVASDGRYHVVACELWAALLQVSHHGHLLERKVPQNRSSCNVESINSLDRPPQLAEDALEIKSLIVFLDVDTKQVVLREMDAKGVL